MKNTHALRHLLALLALPAVISPGAYAAFNKTAGGTYDYLDTANWTSGTIDNNITSNITGDQTITFGTDHTTTSTLTVGNTGLFNHTFVGSGANRTLTFGGNLTLGSSTTNANKVTIGSTTDGQQLNLDMGSASRTFSVGTNRTLEILNTLSGIGGTRSLTKTGAGILVLNGTNTYTGGTNFGASGVIGGVLVVNNLKDGGVASSIGQSSNANTNLIFGGTGTAGTLRYVGTGDSTDRRFQMGGVGATIESSGTGALHFTHASGPTFSTGTSPGVLTLGGTNSDANSFAGAIGNPSSNTTSLTKAGTGRWILTGNNTYTGETIINAGTLQIGAANRISNSSNLVLNGGTFATGGFSETLGTLDLNGNATLDLGAADSDLVFANSSAVAWGTSISLSVVNYTEGVDSLFFGIGGLTNDQLAQITINGMSAMLQDGYLVAAVPEPSTYALLAGAGGLLVVGARRRARIL